MRSEEGVREPFSHFWEEFLRPHSSWLLPDPLGTPAPSRVRGAALSLVSHFPMRASKSTTLGVCVGGCGVGCLGGVHPHPSNDQGERTGGEVLGEPVSAPAPGFAGRLEGRGRMLGQAAWCPALPDFSPACRH